MMKTFDFERGELSAFDKEMLGAGEKNYAVIRDRGQQKGDKIKYFSGTVGKGDVVFKINHVDRHPQLNRYWVIVQLSTPTKER